MIVYSDQKRRIATVIPQDNWRDALIRLGEVEAAIADQLSPNRDAPHPVLDRLRAAAICVASGDLSALSTMPPLPDSVDAPIPEGYAYYALYPEDYADAARRFWYDERPHSAVVVGIRSIGTSLSAMVAAELQRHGCSVSSFTVRPRGHPFDRRVDWHGFDLHPDSWFLVVDEGPGLSGSSFAAVARRLSEAGVPDQRIVLFPSWDADGSTFCSESSRQQWRRHRRYVADSKFAERAGGIDLSGGKWRELLGASVPVYPQHERRKYLCGSHLFKFEGLSDFGQARFERAGVLWEAGLTNRPVALADGYLESEFVPGVPVRTFGADLSEWIARYLSFIQTRFPADRPVPFEENLAMIRTNVAEGLGPAWAARIDRLQRFRDELCDVPTVAIDGRMLPQEFLHTATGYVKTDAIDHYRDHFFPGCQDIAWDFAAVAVEFGFTDLVSAKTQRRIPFYLVAYLSYRMGYCSMAAASGADATHFRVLADQYASRLRDEIDRLC